MYHGEEYYHGNIPFKIFGEKNEPIICDQQNTTTISTMLSRSFVLLNIPTPIFLILNLTRIVTSTSTCPNRYSLLYFVFAPNQLVFGYLFLLLLFYIYMPLFKTIVLTIEYWYLKIQFNNFNQ